MSEFEYAYDYLRQNAKDHSQIANEAQMKQFKEKCKNKSFIYMIRWSDNRFSWGTMSNSNDRLRKSSVLNPKLTGKYDRRVDYLMLKIIHGDPIIFLFEFLGDEKLFESSLKNYFSQNHCYRGFNGQDRKEISELIYSEFKSTGHYKSCTQEDRLHFDQYMQEVFFNKNAWKPIPGSSRSWAWGDSLEPNFLGPKLNLKHLEAAIEKVLKVKF